MGMEVAIPGSGWHWDQIQKAISQFQPPGVIRMADGQLLFPDEAPPETWKEIRVGLPAGMVTLRRQPDRLTLVTWGNISEGLLQERDRLKVFLETGASGVEKGTA